MKFKSLILFLIGFVVVGGFVYVQKTRGLPPPSNDPIPIVDSSKLINTQIVPTMNTPIRSKSNVIWCASFVANWKNLESELAKEPIKLNKPSEFVDLLNNAPDPTSSIPKNSLYTAAGWNDKGIMEKIKNDLAKKFPDKEMPSFPGIVPDSFVSYSYLEATVPFTIPYFQNREPLVFTNGDGTKTKLSSFGIRDEDAYAYDKLRAEPEILYVKAHMIPGDEFIIDLDRNSTPNQIVIALIKPEKSFKQMYNSIQTKITIKNEVEYLSEDGKLNISDSLIIPDILFNISHHFKEIEGLAFENKNLKKQNIDIAQQDILFRLNRSGAELKSEEKMICNPIPSDFIVDRPFLVYIKKRNSKQPYFMIWIDNADFLKKWDR